MGVEEERTVLLALDPGETTGFAVMHMTPVHTRRDFPELVCTGTLSLWRGVEKLIREHRPRVVVYEKFLLYPWKAREQSFSAMPAAQVVGAIEEICERHALHVVGQSAATGKGVRLSPEKKAEIHNRHAIDAYCHGVAYLRTLE